MNIYNSKQWDQDIRYTLSHMPELDLLSGKTIMVTGAAGLICSALVDLLFAYNDDHIDNAPIMIIAAGRWPEEMESRFHRRTHRSDFQFVVYDASRYKNDIPKTVHPDFIIHAASNAFPSMIMKEPVETILANVLGIHDLLNIAHQHNTKRVLYVSSSEVYGQKQGYEPFHEDEYGFIDHLNPRNSYSIGKRAAENMCASFASEYGVESVIVRPGHIYGPTASLMDNRISSAFAWASARGEDLIMKSQGNQLRSYCYCLDCASAMLKVLLCGENGKAYNISNPNSIMTIRDLAEELAKAGGVNLVTELADEKEKSAFNPMSNSSLDSFSLQELGWHGLFGKEGIYHTVRVMKDMLESEPME